MRLSSQVDFDKRARRFSGTPKGDSKMSSNKNSKSAKSEVNATNTNKEETMKNEKNEKNEAKYATDPIAIAKQNLETARAAFKALRGVKAPKSPEVVERQKRIKELRQENKDWFAQIKRNKAIAKSLQQENKALRKAASTPEALRQAKIAVLKAELAYQEACLG